MQRSEIRLTDDVGVHVDAVLVGLNQKRVRSTAGRSSPRDEHRELIVCKRNSNFKFNLVQFFFELKHLLSTKRNYDAWHQFAIGILIIFVGKNDNDQPS